MSSHHVVISMVIYMQGWERFIYTKKALPGDPVNLAGKWLVFVCFL